MEGGMSSSAIDSSNVGFKVCNVDRASFYYYHFFVFLRFFWR